MGGKVRLAIFSFFSTLIELPKQLPRWRNSRLIPPELSTSQPEQPSAVYSETEHQPPLPMIQRQQPVNNHHDEIAMQLPLWRTNRPIPPELPTIRPERPRTVSSKTEEQQPHHIIERQQPVNNHHGELAMQFPLWRTERSILPELPTTRPEQPSVVSSETERMQQQQPPQPMFQQQQPVDNHDDRAQIDDIINRQWAIVVAGACFAAISVILQAQQTRATLPASSFPWFCVVLALAFLALLASVYMRRHYHRASRVFEHVAIFFCAVALLLAIWMTLNPKP